MANDAPLPYLTDGLAVENENDFLNPINIAFEADGTMETMQKANVKLSTGWTKETTDGEDSFTYKLLVSLDFGSEWFEPTDAVDVQVNHFVFMPATIPAETPANDGSTDYVMLKTSFRKERIEQEVKLAQGTIAAGPVKAAVAAVADYPADKQLNQGMYVDGQDGEPTLYDSSDEMAIIKMTDAGITTTGAQTIYEFLPEQTYVALAQDTPLSVQAGIQVLNFLEKSGNKRVLMTKNMDTLEIHWGAPPEKNSAYSLVAGVSATAIALAALLF